MKIYLLGKSQLQTISWRINGNLFFWWSLQLRRHFQGERVVVFLEKAVLKEAHHFLYYLLIFSKYSVLSKKSEVILLRIQVWDSCKLWLLNLSCMLLIHHTEWLKFVTFIMIKQNLVFLNLSMHMLLTLFWRCYG